MAFHQSMVNNLNDWQPVSLSTLTFSFTLCMNTDHTDDLSRMASTYVTYISWLYSGTVTHLRVGDSLSEEIKVQKGNEAGGSSLPTSDQLHYGLGSCRTGPLHGNI